MLFLFIIEKQNQIYIIEKVKQKILCIMETLKLSSFTAMVFLELMAIVVISYKNRNFNGENSRGLKWLIAIFFTATIVLTYFFFEGGSTWNTLISFFFIFLMVFTYSLNEVYVQECNAQAYEDSKKIMKYLIWISIIAIVTHIIATIATTPYWISRDFFIEN